MSSPQTYIADSLSKITLDPGQPRLTWYGADFERIELSGAVLNNWVNKTTNLLVEEFDCEPGVEVCLALPAHWRSIIWALATLRTGSTLTLGEPSATATVLVTTDPASDSAAGRSKRTDLVAVTLAALARKYDGELPAGAIDAASAVMTYGDAIWQTLPTDPSELAIAHGDTQMTFADLSTWAAPSIAKRVLIRCPQVAPDLSAPQADEANAHALLSVVQQCISIWAAGGSVVLLGAQMVAELAEDPQRLERLIASEQVTSGN
ncbi:TIGR03089 family protein [Jonesiaceae bacterium BS-20]|uniref:TIGR03089 family protein n=1 Tax=Jonesiaceae bacterium BS-20 TaxID=3120821 RepID=A0AAU7DY41_9MICO